MGTTTNYGWEVPDVGADADTWGTIQNALFQDIDDQVKLVADTAGVAAPAGAVMDFLRTTAPTGWLVLNGDSVGDADSAGTSRANADAEALFTILWGFTFLPIFAQNGSVSSRGADAATDWAAHKCISLPDQRDRFRRSFKSGGSSGAIGVAQAEMVGPHTHSYQATTSASRRGDSSPLDAFNGSSGGGTYVIPNNVGTENRPANIAYLTCIKY